MYLLSLKAIFSIFSFIWGGNRLTLATHNMNQSLYFFFVFQATWIIHEWSELPGNLKFINFIFLWNHSKIAFNILHTKLLGFWIESFTFFSGLCFELWWLIFWRVVNSTLISRNYLIRYGKVAGRGSSENPRFQENPPKKQSLKNRPQNSKQFPFIACLEHLKINTLFKENYSSFRHKKLFL
jgi:hypothetical protein